MKIILLLLDLTSLTNHGQVDEGVSRRRRLEIHAAPVDAGLGPLDVLDGQLRGRGAAHAEVSARAESRARAGVVVGAPTPAGVAAAAAGVVAGREKY